MNSLRVLIKLFILRLGIYPLASFCKICGHEVRDFHVANHIWKSIERYIPHNGHTLCYDCFCDTIITKLKAQPPRFIAEENALKDTHRRSYIDE